MELCRYTADAGLLRYVTGCARMALCHSVFLNAVLSYVSGASWGSVASIGVALMGIGSGLHADLPILAAAIVTGAYFGDKLSPLSDTTNLTSAVTKTKLYDLIKYLLWTTIPSTIISLLFLRLGMIHTSTGSISPESMQMLVQLKELYKFGLLPLLPMLIVLCFTFCVCLQYRHY